VGDARAPRGAARLTDQRLPAPVRTRLAATRKHVFALKAVLESSTRADFAAAVDGATSEDLIQVVYPLERALEILTNLALELAELGLELAGIAPDRSKSKVLAQLEREGAISRPRRLELTRIYELRNRLQHAYPDVAAPDVYDAAAALLAELPGFLGDYARWLRRLGYGT
jgi:uncharacterized protein YutE (UPF0331/DUF86 family)